MIAEERLQTVQRILQELRQYSQAHADEAWASFVNPRLDEALESLRGNEDDDYISLSGKTLPEIYADMRAEEDKMTMAERLQKLRQPNPLLDDLMRGDD